MWSELISTAGSTRISVKSVAVDATGHVFLTGRTEVYAGVSLDHTNTLVAKYDAAGNEQWTKYFGDGNGNSHGISVAIGGEGNVVLLFRGPPVDLGGGLVTGPMFIAKLDAAGQHIWSHGFAANLGSEPSPRSVAVDASANVLATGMFSGQVDFGGGFLTSAGGQDIFVAKYSAAGNHLWSKRYGGTSLDVGAAITTDAAENVIMTGSGAPDFGDGPLAYGVFAAKLDSAGNEIWSKAMGGSGRVASVVADGPSAIVLGGDFTVGVDFGGGALVNAGPASTRDMFVARLDASGGHLFSQRFGDTASDVLGGLALDSQGNVIVAGSFQGSVDFGGATLVSAGGFDIVLAKFDAAGDPVWSGRFGDAHVQSQLAADVGVDGFGNAVMTGNLGGGVVNFSPNANGALPAASFDIFLAKFGP